MRPQDRIVVQLRENRIARIGTIVRLRVTDGESEPFVPGDKEHPEGEMGRRIEVRWNMNVGPKDPDTVVELPQAAHLKGAVSRPTIARLEKETFGAIATAMGDDSNWVSLIAQCGHEVLLSDYIGTVPYHLEDGLQPHPSLRVRERVFGDRSGRRRSDVLLVDRKKLPVVVECKREALDASSVRQLGCYLRLTEKETGQRPRGILVHGGATKLAKEVRHELRMLRRKFSIDVLRYELSVRFSTSR
jgi:hypothetical protein